MSLERCSNSDSKCPITIFCKPDSKNVKVNKCNRSQMRVGMGSIMMVVGGGGIGVVLREKSLLTDVIGTVLLSLSLARYNFLNKICTINLFS